MEQLDQFAAELVHSRAEVNRRIEFLPGVQQASLAEIERALGAKLGEIDASFGRCDSALKELQQGATAWHAFCGSASTSSLGVLYKTVSA